MPTKWWSCRKAALPNKVRLLSCLRKAACSPVWCACRKKVPTGRFLRRSKRRYLLGGTRARGIHLVLKQSSLWRTIHWTVLAAVELRAKRMPRLPLLFICAEGFPPAEFPDLNDRFFERTSVFRASQETYRYWQLHLRGLSRLVPHPLRP